MNVASLRPMDSIQIGLERCFVLGGVTVDPPSRRVSRGGTVKDLEPRVMQVLVALAQAEGEVVSRDELFSRCWDGRIVGEHAINRVIARLRKLESEFPGAFRIETVTKVGYRLVATGSAPDEPQGPPRPTGTVAASPAAVPDQKPGVSRRLLLAAGGIAVAGAAGLGVHALGRRRQPTATALAFYRKGVEAQRQGLAEQNEQALVHFRKAVDADPRFAEAWGALALSYRHLLEMRPTGDEAALAQSARSAAMRALELDPGNADARTALILIPPIFGNWAKIEADCRAALARHPDAWLLHGNLGNVALETGRPRAAIAHFERAIAIDQFLPVSWAKRAEALWWANRIEEADLTLVEALERWPRHPRIWLARCRFLTFAGRPDEALLMIANRKAHPFGVPASTFDDAALVARARASAGAAETRAALDRLRPGAVAEFVWLCCAAGQPEAALARLGAYFAIPEDAAAPQLVRRYTAFLFAPPSAPLWPMAGFSSLTERIGLERYWSATGSLPDHRKP